MSELENKLDEKALLSISELYMLNEIAKDWSPMDLSKPENSRLGDRLYKALIPHVERTIVQVEKITDLMTK